MADNKDFAHTGYYSSETTKETASRRPSKEAASRRTSKDTSGMTFSVDAMGLSPRPRRQDVEAGTGSAPVNALALSPREPPRRRDADVGTRSAPTIGMAPPGHWADLARMGYFSEEPRSRFEKFADHLADQVSGLSERLKKKPVPFRYWGSAPQIRREWYYLTGPQTLPLGRNRWEPFPPEVQNMISTAAELRVRTGPGFIANVEDEEQQQVWSGMRLGPSTDIVGFNPAMWHPTGAELPDSELLLKGQGRIMEGYFMSFAAERELVEEFNSTPLSRWTRDEFPRLRVVLLVEETMESAVEQHSHELLSNPDYVLRVFNQHGLPVIGFKKHEILEHSVRELRFRFDGIWLGNGEPCFIEDDRELHSDEPLKRLFRKGKKQVNVKVMYLTEEQMKMKRAGHGAILGGHYADLAMEGYFAPQEIQEHHGPPTVQGCCVVS